MSTSVVKQVDSISAHVSDAQNAYLPKIAILDRVVPEITDVKTFYWRFEDAAEQRVFQRFRPGQFAQVSLFGVGEFPTSLPPSPTEDETFFTVRRVGSCTAALHKMNPATSSPFAVRTATASRWRNTTGKAWCSSPAALD